MPARQIKEKISSMTVASSQMSFLEGASAETAAVVGLEETEEADAQLEEFRQLAQAVEADAAGAVGSLNRWQGPPTVRAGPHGQDACGRAAWAAPIASRTSGSGATSSEPTSPAIRCVQAKRLQCELTRDCPKCRNVVESFDRCLRGLVSLIFLNAK